MKRHIADFKRFSINEDDSQLAFDFGEIKPLPGSGKMMTIVDVSVSSADGMTLVKFFQGLSKYNLGIRNVEDTGGPGTKAYPKHESDYSFDIFGKAEDIKRLVAENGIGDDVLDIRDM